MSNVWFALNRREAGSQLLRRNEGMLRLQNDAASKILSIASAQFFQQFGFEGRFEITQSTRVRTNVRLAAADARTAAALKQHPGWLDQFKDNM